MSSQFTIAGVTPTALPASPRHVKPWKSMYDPLPGWYLTFSAALYEIEPQFRRPLAGERAHKTWAFQLTPVVNRPVYTFEDWGDFIAQSRNFTVDLFTKTFIPNVSQYRVIRGAPRVHYLYKLPPHWTWSDK